MQPLHVIPIYMSTWPDLVETLCPALERILQDEVAIHHHSFDPEDAFDPGRGQYNSRILLGLMLDEPVPEESRVLGVTGVDLFIPVLTYVFGEAQLDGRAAVVSIHRLRSEVYGLPPDERLLEKRLVKEAVHELGHTHGLVHCHESSCVMSSSTYVDEIDLKAARFCVSCAAAIGKPAQPPLGEDR